MSTDTQNSAPVSAEPVALPQCPFQCGWDGLHKIAVQDAAYLAKVQWPEDEEGVSVPRATAMRSMDYLIQVCRTMLNAAPVATQPGLTQQTLDDVKAGIPARDAEIAALHREIEALQAVQPRRLIFPTMLRKMWSGSEVQAWLDDELAKLTKSSSQQAQQPVSGADALLMDKQPCYNGQNPSKNIGAHILPETALAKLTEPHNGKQHQESQDSPSHQNIKDQLRHHASPVTAQVDAIIVQNIDGGAELSGKLRTLLSEGQIFAAVQCLTAEVREDNGLIVLSNVNSCIRTLEQAVLKKVAAQHTATLASIEAFVACDASAISYLSLGEYRTALLKMLREGAKT